MALRCRVVNAPGSGRNADAGLVRAALASLVWPADGVEMRGLKTIPGRKGKVPSIHVFAGGDLDGMTAKAVALNGDGYQVYVCLNPVPNVPGRKRDLDVLSRRWLMIDVDPIRAAEFADDSATDQEKEACRQVTASIYEDLTERHWPEPAVVDSGNGFYLLYRVDLPNTKHARLLCQGVLKALAEKYPGVDTKTFNASRIAKVPGTWSLRGRELSDRPYRMARMLSFPESPEPVTAEQLQELARLPDARPEAPQAAASSAGSGLKVRVGGSGDMRAYARAALRAEAVRVRLATPGGSGGQGRNDTLYRAAANMGEMVAAGWILRQEVEAALRQAAVVAGLADDPGCGERGIEATLRNGIERGMEHPRQALERNGATPGNGVILDAADAVPEGQSIIVRASAITPKKVEWLWPYRIPLGKLCTFAGVGGLGKTFVMLDVAARVSVGNCWPDSMGVCCDPGQVLFLSGEDDPDDTLVPRLIELGANLDRVAFLRSEVQDRFTLGDIRTLDRALAEIGPDVRFVAIDPPACFLGDADDHKNAEVRGLLSPLKTWAAANRLAVVFNTHFTKPSGAKVEAAMRVMGSVAWVNAVRAAHIFARDPEEPEKVLFVPLKMNVGKRKKALSYRIAETHDDLARVEWLGEVDVSADDAANREKGKPRRVVAAEWLVEQFRKKREWESEALFHVAREAGISRSAIFEAKDKLDLPRARRVVGEDGDVTFHWWVPEGWLPPPKYRTVEPVEPVDEETF